MAKYLIKWDAGFGEIYDVVDADNLEEAKDMAYDAWADAAQSAATYDAKELTEELAEEYGYKLEDE